MTDPAHEPLAFTLEWLAEAGHDKPQLTVCPDGHLLVRERTCWSPARFSADLRALYCVPVDHPVGGDQ